MKKCSGRRQTLGKLLRAGRKEDVRRDADPLWDIQLCCSEGQLRAAWGTNELGCQIWMGATNGNGRGMYGGTPVHRSVSAYFDGAIEKGVEIHHTCGKGLCALPAHLQRTSRSAHRALHKNAPFKRRGKKLTEEAVRALCGELLNGSAVKDVAVRFAIREPMVYHILHGRRWSNISRSFFPTPWRRRRPRSLL